MGLREKQLVRSFREEKIPYYNEQIKEITGGGVFEWDVDWDSFLPSENALLYVENQGFVYVVDAIRAICYNDFGKEAVREGLKKIVLKNLNTTGEKSVTFDSGTLRIHGDWASGTSEGYPDSREIQRVLEDGL